MTSATIETRKLALAIKSVRDAGGRDDIGRPVPLVLAFGNGRINLRVRSHAVCLQASAPAECSGFCTQVGVDLEHLGRMVAAMTSSTVTLTVDEDGMRMGVKSGAFKSNLYWVRAEGGAPRDDESAAMLDVPAAALTELLRSTSYAMSNDSKRPALCGVQLRCASDVVTATATDGHRLARVHVDVTGCARIIPASGVVVGAAGVGAVMGLAARADVARISVQRNNLVVATDGEVPVVLHAALLDGEFPNADAAIPNGNQTTMSTGADLLAENVRRVAHIQHTAETFRLDVHAEGVRLTCSDPATGEATDDHQAPVTGPAVSVGVNARYLQDALRQLADAGRITLAFGDELSAVYMTAKNHVAVIMPMRI